MLTVRGQGGLPNNSSKKRTLCVNQLATHLPDVVVFVDHKKTMPFQNKLQGVLMFLDISGFTALCERYAMNSKNGTDQLTKTLNGYMEALVSEILHSDGDVLKFAGDAILTLWQVDSFMKMKSAINQVITCAMGIQKRYGEWTTDIGVKLRVKIGIAAGELSITFVGNNEFCHYVTLGRAVEAVNLAEKFCTSGDVVASPSVWCHCAGLEIEHETLHDRKHVKILTIEEPPETLLYDNMNTMCMTASMGSLLDHSKGSNSNLSLSATASHLSAVMKDTSTDSLSLISSFTRPSVRKSIINQLDDYAEMKKKLYIAKPVLRKIEDHQPLEYLSEMRQVTILFINLTIQECTYMEMALVLQEAFDVIYSNVKRSQGCLNKIFAFDKGSTFLVIFGLPGFKHDNDCAHALRCADKIHVELADVKPIKCCSIGVTTGSTYCGVVGHDHRHEYTVIGRKVNMAARLMMHYPNQVTCDNETYHHSKLSKGNFHQLEIKEMKGLSDVGSIREYKPSADPKVMIENVQKYDYPIIGRENELKCFMDEVNYIQNHQGAAKQRQAIVFDGESGIGRTMLLDAVIAKAVRAKIRVITCSLTLHDAKSPFYAMKSLLIDLLDFSFDMSHQERENAFLEMFKNDPFIIEHADLLNDILHVQFEPKDEVTSKDRELNLYEVIFKVIKESNKKLGFIIFTIDDAHFMDSDSWEFVRVLGKDEHSLVVMTLRMPFHMSETAEEVINNNTTLRLTLQGLQPQYLAALGCQLLGVTRMPLKLENILRDKSHGVPSWCEQLLREMTRDNVIMVQQVTEDSEISMVTPSSNYLDKRRGIYEASLNEGQREVLDQSVPKLMCTISPGKSLNIDLPDSIKGMIQARIDRMEELDQLIIKSASILGMSFPRPLLEELLPRNISKERFGKALQRLASFGIFVCAYPLEMNKHNMANKQVSQDQILKIATCECPLLDGTIKAKPMEECQLIRFYGQSMQETAYEMYLENTRRTLHIKAAKFLESLGHRCKACGGDGFLQHLLLKQHDQENRNNDASHWKSPAWMLTGHGGKGSAPKQPSKDNELEEFTILPACGEERYQKSGRRRSSVAQVIRSRFHRGPPTFCTDSQLSNHPSFDSNSRRSSIEKVSTLMKPIDSTSRRSSKTSRNFEPSNGDDYSIDDTDGTLVDLRECECMKMLMIIYPQLVRHWKSSGNVAKTLHYLLEASASSIATHDNLQALSYLREVSNIMDAVAAKQNPFEGEVAVVEQYRCNDWERSRMESLSGQALFHMGQMEESIPHFKTALTLLGCVQPKSKFKRSWSLFTNGLTQLNHDRFPDRYLGNASFLQQRPLSEQAHCLSHLLHWYLVNRQDTQALSTVLQQLNKAEAANTDLHEVIMAYICMMECCHVFLWRKLGEAYEFKAEQRCLSAMERVSSEDLVTVTHFFVTSFNLRLCWGKIQQAVDSGYLAHQMSQKIHDNDLSLQLLPVLSQALIMANRVYDAVDILKDLKYTQEQTNDKMAEALYYSTCLDIILETGFQLESYKRCIKYDSKIWNAHYQIAVPKTQFFIQANVALWYARKNEWRKAQQWFSLVDNVVWGSNETFLSVRGLVKVIEFKLIKLSQTLSKNPRRSPVVMEIEVSIKKDLTELEYICKRMPVFEPRYLHLCAYNRAILSQNNLAKKFLSKAIRTARSMDNNLEMEWVKHSGQVWYDPHYDQHQADFWLEHADEQMLDWHMANRVEGSQIKFSLPLPHWFKHK